MNNWQVFMTNVMRIASIKFPVLNFNISLWQLFSFFLVAELFLRFVFGIINRKKESGKNAE